MVSQNTPSVQLQSLWPSDARSDPMSDLTLDPTSNPTSDIQSNYLSDLFGLTFISSTADPTFGKIFPLAHLRFDFQACDG